MALLVQSDYDALAAQVIQGMRSGKVITDKAITRITGTAVQVVLTYADGTTEVLAFTEDTDTRPFGT